MSYAVIRNLHLASVVFTLAFFALRLYWALGQSQRIRQPWVRLLSALNDTLLLSAGIALMVMSSQYPTQASWLAAKLLALVVYIGLGIYALHLASQPIARLAAGLATLATGLYILGVALSRSPMPDWWLVWWRLMPI